VGLAVDPRGRVWVANADAGSLSRLDANGSRTDLSAHVGTAPLRLATTGGSVWASVFSDGTLRRVDPRTGRVTDTVRVGAEPEGLTVAFGSLWVVLQASAELLRVDPGRGRILDRYRVGEAPRLVTAGDGSLWVSDFASGRVLRIEAASGDVRRSAPICQGPQGMRFSRRELWVACTTGEALVAVDPTTLQRVATLKLPGSPDSVVAGPQGRLLISLQKGPSVAVVDPRTPAVVRRILLGHEDQLYDSANVDVVYANGRAWVSSYQQGGVYRAALGDG
jgi:streptogramin lyase